MFVRAATTWKQHTSQLYGAEHNLRLQYQRQVEVTAGQAASHDHHASLLQALLYGSHAENGTLQAANDDLRAANDQLQLEIDLHEDLLDAEVADHHLQVADLIDRINHLQLNNFRLQDKLSNVQDAREREFAERCSESDCLRDQNATLVTELEDKDIVEEALRKEISMVLARNVATLVSIGMPG